MLKVEKFSKAGSDVREHRKEGRKDFSGKISIASAKIWRDESAAYLQNYK